MAGRSPSPKQIKQEEHRRLKAELSAVSDEYAAFKEEVLAGGADAVRSRILCESETQLSFPAGASVATQTAHDHRKDALELDLRRARVEIQSLHDIVRVSKLFGKHDQGVTASASKSSGSGAAARRELQWFADELQASRRSLLQKEIEADELRRHLAALETRTPAPGISQRSVAIGTSSTAPFEYADGTYTGVASMCDEVLEELGSREVMLSPAPIRRNANRAGQSTCGSRSTSPSVQRPRLTGASLSELATAEDMDALFASTRLPQSAARDEAPLDNHRDWQGRVHQLVVERDLELAREELLRCHNTMAALKSCREGSHSGTQEAAEADQRACLECDGYRAEAETLRHDVASHADRLAELDEQVAALEDRNSSLQQQLTEEQETMRRFKAQSSVLVRRVQGRSHDAQCDMRDELTAAQQDAHTLRLRCRELEADLTDCKEEGNEKQSRIDRLESSVAVLSRQRTALLPEAEDQPTVTTSTVGTQVGFSDSAVPLADYDESTLQGVVQRVSDLLPNTPPSPLHLPEEVCRLLETLRLQAAVGSETGHTAQRAANVAPVTEAGGPTHPTVKNCSQQQLQRMVFSYRTQLTELTGQLRRAEHRIHELTQYSEKLVAQRAARQRVNNVGIQCEADESEVDVLEVLVALKGCGVVPEDVLAALGAKEAAVNDSIDVVTRQGLKGDTSSSNARLPRQVKVHLVRTERAKREQEYFDKLVAESDASTKRHRIRRRALQKQRRTIQELKEELRSADEVLHANDRVAELEDEVIRLRSELAGGCSWLQELIEKDNKKVRFLDDGSPVSSIDDSTDYDSCGSDMDRSPSAVAIHDVSACDDDADDANAEERGMPEGPAFERRNSRCNNVPPCADDESEEANPVVRLDGAHGDGDA